MYMVKQGREYECKLQNALFYIGDRCWMFSETMNVDKEHFSIYIYMMFIGLSLKMFELRAEE